MSETCIKHIENYWKILTTKGNELFDKGAFEQALDSYQNALYRAEVLNNNFSDCIRLKIPFIQVYVISCNNLANCYQEMKDLKKADEMLRRTIYFLSYFSEENYTEIQRELRKSTINYINFIQKNNLETKTENIVFNLLKKTNDLRNIKLFDYVQFN